MAPKLYQFIDGVLTMELVQNTPGLPALPDRHLSLGKRSQGDALDIDQRSSQTAAKKIWRSFRFVIFDDTEGPVIIDFPQACDPAFNRNARRLLLRDVRNVTRFMGKFAPHLNKLKIRTRDVGSVRTGRAFSRYGSHGAFCRKKKEAVDTHSLPRQSHRVQHRATGQDGPKLLNMLLGVLKTSRAVRKLTDPKPLPERFLSMRRNPSTKRGATTETLSLKDTETTALEVLQATLRMPTKEGKPLRRRRGQRRDYIQEASAVGIHSFPLRLVNFRGVARPFPATSFGCPVPRGVHGLLMRLLIGNPPYRWPSSEAPLAICQSLPNRDRWHWTECC